MQNVLFFLLISLSTLSCKSQELGSTTSSDSKFTEKEATQQFPDEPQSDQVITKIALGSCYQPHYRKANIWSIITKQSPQLFLFMGDNIYADTTDMDKLRSIYQKLNNQPDYAAFKKQTRILPIWDDHDYGINDSGAEHKKKKESQENFQNAFSETFPKEHPARQTPGIYHSYTSGPDGQKLQIIMLDTRYFRSELDLRGKGRKAIYHPVTDPHATQLGSQQWAWLEHLLLQPADLRLIVSSIQIITTNHRFEKWNNIPAERQKLIDLLKSTNTQRVVLLSGDRHLAEFSMMPQQESGLPYKLYELTSSGMTHAGAQDSGNTHRIDNSYYRGTNFGSLNIKWHKTTAPHVTLNIHKDNGKIFKSHRITFPN